MSMDKNLEGVLKEHITSARISRGDTEIKKNVEDQEDELLALSSIYDSNVLLLNSNSSPPTGQLILHPTLPEIFRVVCKSPAVDNAKSKTQEVQVQFLPPIVLHFHLPETYPSKTCPAFLLSCQWLTLKQLSALCSQLEKKSLESRGDVILYLWSQFLQEDALSFLDIKDSLNISPLVTLQTEKFMSYRYRRQKSECSVNIGEDVNKSSVPYKTNVTPQVTRGNSEEDSRAVVDLIDGSVLLPLIIEYNEQKKEEAFIQGWYKCKVCLTEKLGANCMRFHGCDHVYCRACMKGYFSVQINDGNVKFLACPDDKCTSQALPSQVYDLVGPVLFARYDKLLLAKTLDSMSDVTYCPRVSCQSAVLVEPDYPMASCAVCQYVFCLLCRLAYHGVAPCRFRAEERNAIRDKYMAATAEEKRSMESRYGKQTLQRLVDDTQSEEWLKLNSKNCPHCSAAIEKLDGCNKMICWRCNTFFCWLCRTHLDPNKPYVHFRDPKSRCFDQLFFGMADDDDEWDFGLFL